MNTYMLFPLLVTHSLMSLARVLSNGSNHLGHRFRRVAEMEQLHKDFRTLFLQPHLVPQHRLNALGH